MIETSWDLLRLSLAIFVPLRKMFGNVRKRSSYLANRAILENLRKSSDSGQKSSENRQKLRHKNVYIINKIIHVCLYIWNFSSRVQRDISLVCCAHLVEHSHVGAGVS